MPLLQAARGAWGGEVTQEEGEHLGSQEGTCTLSSKLVPVYLKFFHTETMLRNLVPHPSIVHKGDLIPPLLSPGSRLSNTLIPPRIPPRPPPPPVP